MLRGIIGVLPRSYSFLGLRLFWGSIWSGRSEVSLLAVIFPYSACAIVGCLMCGGGFSLMSPCIVLVCSCLFTSIAYFAHFFTLFTSIALYLWISVLLSIFIEYFQLGGGHVLFIVWNCRLIFWRCFNSMNVFFSRMKAQLRVSSYSISWKILWYCSLVRNDWWIGKWMVHENINFNK